MKTAISIPDAIFEAGERVALSLGLTRSEMYARAVEAFVGRHGGAGVTARLDGVYGGERPPAPAASPAPPPAEVREAW